MASKRKVNLNDYEMTTTLGTGSFGRVRLCRNKKTGEYFAMKALKKADIIKLKQVDHVISENTILADIEHPFLVRITHLQSQLSFLRWASRVSPRIAGICTSYSTILPVVNSSPTLGQRESLTKSTLSFMPPKYA
jgi:serine/threonine protein kinase